MNLYNIKLDAAAKAYGTEQYIINKFDMDVNHEATYLVSRQGCSCPAASRPTCKHRKMIDHMQLHLGDGWFLCWETQKWHRPMDYSDDLNAPVDIMGEVAGVRGEAEGKAEGSTNLPDGVTAISFDDPSLMHKVIGEAVGEAPRPLVTRR